MNQYRQGDLLITPVKEIKGRKQKDKIVAYGEGTGHTHQVVDGDVYRTGKNGAKYLDLPVDTKLVHDEHGPIDLPKGKYKVQQQREYKPKLKKAVRIVD